MGFDAVDRRFARTKPIALECLRCGTAERVEMQASRTAYHFDVGAEDPNLPIPLCRPCAAEHHLHWDQTWAAYHAGLL